METEGLINGTSHVKKEQCIIKMIATFVLEVVLFKVFGNRARIVLEREELIPGEKELEKELCIIKLSV